MHDFLTLVIIPNIGLITGFMVACYGMGWALVGNIGRRCGMIDLCQFIRQYLFAPFVLMAVTIVLFLIVSFITKILIPHFLELILGLALLAIAVATFFILGKFVVAPVVKKSVGVVKPFTSKICVVMYEDKSHPKHPSNRYNW